MTADHEAAIREALTRLIWQDRFETPYADAASNALDSLLAELAAAREELETEKLNHIACGKRVDYLLKLNNENRERRMSDRRP